MQASPDLDALRRLELRLKAYILVGQDLMLAARACEFTRRVAPGESHPDYYFASLAVIICYARPFSGNRPRIELPSHWTAFSTAAQREAHETALSLRKRVYAHSDSAAKDVVIQPDGAEVYTDGTDVEIRQRFNMQTKHATFPILMLEPLQQAITYMRATVHHDMRELRDLVHAAKGHPLEKFEIGKHSLT